MGQQLDKPFNINIACCNSYDEEDNVDADVSCDEEVDSSPPPPPNQRDDDDELKQ